MRTLNEIDIAYNIKEARNRCSMSQEEVALYLGISLRTYKSYENNAKNIKATTLYMLSLLFSCSIENFYMPLNFPKCEDTKSEFLEIRM